MQLDDAGLVRVLRALADPKRFRMVQEVAAAGELSCGQIGERFPLSQPTVSHHLKILIAAGIFATRPEGQHHFLSVNRPVIEEVAAVLPGRLAPPPRRLRRLQRSLPRSTTLATLK
jgi:DNA-binding transcriptional ArsR family regulator